MVRGPPSVRIPDPPVRRPQPPGGVGVRTTNGPPGGALSVVTDPGIPGVVYTEAFRSLDGGMTWAMITV